MRPLCILECRLFQKLSLTCRSRTTSFSKVVIYSSFPNDEFFQKLALTWRSGTPSFPENLSLTWRSRTTSFSSENFSQKLPFVVLKPYFFLQPIYVFGFSFPENIFPDIVKSQFSPVFISFTEKTKDFLCGD